VGIDTSEMMIETCRRRAREEGLDDRCSFIQTDPAHYRPDSAFDVCTAMGLLDYVREPLPMMAKMREMVRDRAIMSFPRRLTWRAPVRKVRLMLKGCYVRFYTRKEIERLVEEAGFARHDCQVIGKLYCVTALVE
ncbi:methyltransferase domain-containing protein, partial [Candidatus Fermentibacterales bacterium]|nr:methyltransferase domain-containing protein [Candidatus Fermentibacterales bacterium]